MSDRAFEEQLSQLAGSKQTQPKLTRTGKILLGITGASFVGVCAATLPFILPAARRICLPYVPATPEQVHGVMFLLKRCKPGRLVDLGSGDGRIVIEAAQHGFQAVGVELNPWLVLYSRLRAFRVRASGMSGTTSFVVQNLWKHNLSIYDQVVIFGVDSMMPSLHQKLIREMTDSCQVIACRFPLPCEPSLAVGRGLDTIWMYTHADIVGSSGKPHQVKESASGPDSEKSH